MQKQIVKGADVWIWGLTPETVASYNEILPFPVALDKLQRSSFLPVQKSWMNGLNNSDFYFCELQKTDASGYSLKGALVEEGEVLLNACKTDWRKWNKRPEEIKTAGTDIDKIMPPISRFGGGGRAKKKLGVIEKLRAFFEKYFGIGGSSSFTE